MGEGLCGRDPLVWVNGQHLVQDINCYGVGSLEELEEVLPWVGGHGLDVGHRLERERGGEGGEREGGREGGGRGRERERGGAGSFTVSLVIFSKNSLSGVPQTCRIFVS